jgi:hypothetical protein
MRALFFSSKSRLYASFNNWKPKIGKFCTETSKVLSELAASTDKIVRYAGFNVWQVERVGSLSLRARKVTEPPSVPS